MNGCERCGRSDGLRTAPGLDDEPDLTLCRECWCRECECWPYADSVGHNCGEDV